MYIITTENDLEIVFFNIISFNNLKMNT